VTLGTVRVVHAQPPSQTGVHDGLAWSLFEPAGPTRGALLILHGADSRKENHHDVARAAAGGGLAALAFDARGHGASAGALGAGAVDDVVAMAALLRERAGGGPVALRGSSMGGYLALVAARAAGAAAVVAVCPAGAAQLRRGLEAGRYDFRLDRPGLEALLDGHDAHDAAAALHVPLLLLHAQGDESVPVQQSRELAAVAPDCKYVEIPGGHHRSIQHDAELTGVSVRFVLRALRRASGPDRPGGG
jgi:pimeloyl-ACP methyl ester carboxylesterase